MNILAEHTHVVVVEFDQDARMFLDDLIRHRISGKKNCSWQLFTGNDYETKCGQYVELYGNKGEVSIVDLFHLYMGFRQ